MFIKTLVYMHTVNKKVLASRAVEFLLIAYCESAWVKRVRSTRILNSLR